jgi:hypothetical protein
MAGHNVTRNNLTGVITTTGIEDGKVYTKTEQNVEPFLRNADKSRHAHGTNFSDVTGGMYKRATIPLEALQEWRVNYGFDWFNCSEADKRKWMKTEHFRKYELRRGSH